MKFPKPKPENKQPTRVIPQLSPLLERLFKHGQHHPNDKCAWEIITFHQVLYNAWLTRNPKKSKKSLDN